MRKKWKSYIYVPALALALAASGMYLIREQTNTNSDIQKQIYHLDEYFNMQETPVPDAHVVDEQNVLLEQPQVQLAEEKAQFILRLEDDFVVVYRTEDESKCYMVTGISSSDLPTNTVEELKAGKEILNEEALYFFLESHSS